MPGAPYSPRVRGLSVSFVWMNHFKSLFTLYVWVYVCRLWEKVRVQSVYWNSHQFIPASLLLPYLPVSFIVDTQWCFHTVHRFSLRPSYLIHDIHILSKRPWHRQQSFVITPPSQSPKAGLILTELCLLGSGIKGVHYFAWVKLQFLKMSFPLGICSELRKPLSIYYWCLLHKL